MLGERINEITWAQFEVCNENPQSAFENMCRWLFNDFFFNGKAILHSEPNNPGVEVVPVYHEDTKKRISFQAKFFSEMDYEQIKHSAQTAVNHYAGELDAVYLYCNKDVTTTGKGYQAVVSILDAYGIQIVPITNQEILTQVMKNETIAWQYFDYFTTTDICQWKDDRPALFDSIDKRLILQDVSGQKWVSLYILDIQRREPSKGDDDHFGWSNGTQEVWYQAKASFIKKMAFRQLKIIWIPLKSHSRIFPRVRKLISYSAGNMRGHPDIGAFLRKNGRNMRLKVVAIEPKFKGMRFLILKIYSTIRMEK